MNKDKTFRVGTLSSKKIAEMLDIALNADGVTFGVIHNSYVAIRRKGEEVLVVHSYTVQAEARKHFPEVKEDWND